jgi:hypothetical protein
VNYVVWRRPDEKRLYSTIMVSHPESCLFRLIINNMIFCLIETAINKKGTHILSPKMPHHTLTLNRLWKFSSTAILLLLLLSNCFEHLEQTSLLFILVT